ncbi:aminotransferase class V-fold PLP-dependent enzyme [Alkalihalophilus pseudofirmus]|uniref:Aminotransferase class V-fold PLP-dependent enzyme n=1 Tax=Alkalihalophilus pseudofirmus TaxID=79885 RepID=A0AAJ2KUE3_ALKPS|nr:aminotransferase class V-fold PLP-dependent enzyme [Alkalihalophilus pseudofirmus]MDV2884687.1 aminotransferase class V-fold PLP-dependent enzyme [Alkalihalophilus pseudofirmus]
MLYLDNSATTQMLPEVKEAMIPYLLEEFGNPSSKYYNLATKAKEATEDSRKYISALLGCDTDEVIFTSGATESNNMIIKGIADFYGENNKHIVTSKIEHPAVIETCRYLEKKGFTITYLDVDANGLINLEELRKILVHHPPLLVTIMWGNNEIGSLQPIKEISDLCFENNVFFHTDATQTVGKVPCDLSLLEGLQFLSCSAHKFHGPKGIGVSIIKKDKNNLKRKITPLLHGGGQESDYRSGTLPVHNIVGMGIAAKLAHSRIDDNINHLIRLEQYLIDILKENFGEVLHINNNYLSKIPGIISVQFKGINNEMLIKKLSDVVALSSGSACSTSKPSHVLEAIGLDQKAIRSTIRFSLSPYIEIQDLNIFKEM